MPRVSVIVPVYNMQPYINRCVESILNQTEKSIEVILVNDGSTDSSGAICDDYALIDDRIKVIHKENGGLSSARNAGINLASGEYIAFVDSDDYIDENMYECMLEASEKHQAPLVVAGRYDHSDNLIQTALTLESERLMTSREAVERILTWDGIDSSACDKLFSHMLFSSIRFPEGKYNEDVFIMTDIIIQAHTIVHIGVPKYHYVHRDNSITTGAFNPQKLDLLDATRHVMETVQNYYPALKEKAVYYHTRSILYLYPLLIQSPKYKSSSAYEVVLREELSENIVKMLSNSVFTKREKIIILMLYLHLYKFARKSYHFIKCVKRRL